MDRVQGNLSELRFWLQVMGDYARFIRDSLIIKEAQEILEAQKYITLFDDLLARGRKPLAGGDLMELNRQSYREAEDFRKYILHIADRQLTEAVIVNMTPAFLNHMVNDSEYFLDSLSGYTMGREPVLNPVEVSLKWLLNLYEATLSLQDKLGSVFFIATRRAGMFSVDFLNLYYQAYVLNGLRRAGLKEFPSVQQMNEQIRDTMTSFGEYLVDLIRQTLEKKIVGTQTLLYLDNIYREVCYFLTRLAQADGVPPPACDPASPRMESSYQADTLKYVPVKKE